MIEMDGERESGKSVLAAWHDDDDDDIYKPEFVLENETHKYLGNFEIQTDHLIPARKTDLMKIKKKENMPCDGVCRASGLQNENQRKRKEKQIFEPCQINVKLMED